MPKDDGFTKIIGQKKVYDLLEDEYSGIVYLDDPDHPFEPENAKEK